MKKLMKNIIRKGLLILLIALSLLLISCSDNKNTNITNRDVKSVENISQSMDDNEKFNN